MSAELTATLSVAHRNSLRLLKLVNTLLDFSRIEAGRIDASYEPTDLAAFTAELASVFRSATEKAGLQLRVECAPLPEPIYIDRDMWEKIVLNLLSNAFNFTFEGEIVVELRWLGEGVELRVADTGIGIAEADLPRMFERFHRVKNARARTHEGTGIGLALVHELVRLHAGTVAVNSREGCGTSFVVTIPRGSSHLPAERVRGARQLAPTSVGALPYVEEALRWLPSVNEAERPTPDAIVELPEAVATDSSPTRARILLADDNADMRDYLQRMLAQSYDVEAVADGSAALERVQAAPPDLVLTDVMMPRLDGFALLAAIRADERSRSIPVILLSARAGEEARIEGLRAGADEYLVKPFSTRELLARVASQLELARLRRDTEQAVQPPNDAGERVVAITVADTGIGIPNELLPRMFELFMQGEQPPGRSRGGLGIGLALARRLIEMHGGTIEAHSEGRGRGSAFVVKLPLHRLAAKRATASGADVRPIRGRVLIIDDNEDAAETVAMLVERLGGSARTAHDAIRGLESIAEFEPHIVFLDLGMPGIDGYEACRRIRGEHPGSSIVVAALSGWGQPQDKQRAFEAGFDLHLTKPVDPKVLRGLLADNAEACA